MTDHVLCTSLNAESGPHLQLLTEAGLQPRVVDRAIDLWSEENLSEQLQGVRATVAGSEPYTESVLRSATELRVIARTGVGYDAIDLETCDELGIAVFITPGVNHHSVAEHTIASLMAVARGFPEQHNRVVEYRWKRVATPRVMGRTLGIVGLGRIGQAVATRAAGLGLDLLTFEPYPNEEFLKEWSIESVSLNELYSRSDFISLHCPSTPESRHMINADSLRTIKPGAVIINTARGSLIDEEALLTAVESGHLRGAALDVFEVEPLPADSPLIRSNRILLSGHVAGLDEESHDGSFTMAAESIRSMRDGVVPEIGLVNKPGLDDWNWDDSRS